MTHFGSYKKRDLQGSIRRNIYAWMAPEKMSHRLISRFLRIDQNPHECSFVKKRPVQEDNTFIDKRRKLQPKFLFWGVQLLLAVGFNVAKRYVKSWTASFAKEKTPLRRTVSELRISGETKSKTIIGPPQRMQQREWGQTQTPKPSAARVLDLLRSAAKEWSQDKCPQLGALAYYTIFSLAPLVLVLLGVFGLIYSSNEQAREKILEQLRYLMDPGGLKVFQDIANSAAEPKAGILATAIGILIALFGASGIFGQLQDALNTIWAVKPKPSQGIWGFIRARFLSFAMVGGVCFLLLVSLTVEGLLKGLHSYLQSIVPGGHYLGLAIFYLFDLAIIVLLFAMLFRYLPDAKIAWRDVWTGAALTAILFVILIRDRTFLQSDRLRAVSPLEPRRAQVR
jgi:YihY family inner membrane protein